MQWDRENTLVFIDKYKERSILWDPKHEHHYNKIKKEDAWIELAEEMSVEVEECKRKITSLLASLRREKGRIKKSTGTGKGAEEVYESTWFAFKPLLFLLDRNKPGPTEDTIQCNDNSGNKQLPEQNSGTTTDSSCQQNTKKRKSIISPEEVMVSTLDILKKRSEQNQYVDECDAFGAFIAKKLKSYSQRTRAYVQHNMSNVLFSADRGEYEYPLSSVHNINSQTASTSEPPSPQVSEYSHQKMDKVTAESDSVSGIPPVFLSSEREVHGMNDEGPVSFDVLQNGAKCTVESIKVEPCLDDEIHSLSSFCEDREEHPMPVFIPLMKYKMKEESDDDATFKDRVNKGINIGINEIKPDSMEWVSNRQEDAATREIDYQEGYGRKSDRPVGVKIPGEVRHRRRRNNSYASIKVKCHKCQICSKMFYKTDSLQAHIRTHTGEKPFKCEVCNKRFSERVSVLRHRLVHTGERPFSCDICGKSFSQRAHLNDHHRIHTGEKPYKCETCNKEFSHNGNLVKHKLLHTGDKTYKCDICQKKFTRSDTLRKHSHIHMEEKPFKCDECDKKFTCKYTLKRHCFNHLGERPYYCEICHKVISGNDCIVHRLLHKCEKPYPCSVCNKGFARSSHLARHQLIHTGEKLHMCDVCSKKFSQRSHLTNHYRIHTGIKPYTCDICSKGFSQSGNLMTHRLTHSIEKPYGCDLCNKQFTHRNGLKKHYYIHTRNV